MGLMDVLTAVADDVKTRKPGEKPPKRYIMFELEEWYRVVDKPLGRAVSATQAKAIFVNMLAKLASGEWKLDVPTKG